MFSHIAVQACSLVYICLLLFVFLRKRKVKNIEGTIYMHLLVLTAIVLSLDLASIISINAQCNARTMLILNKSYLVSSIIWCYWLMTYLFTLNSQKNYQNFKEIIKKSWPFKLGFLATIAACVGAALLNHNYDIKLIYQNGQDLYYTFVTCFLYMGIMAIYVVINPRKIRFSKRIPIFILLFLGLISIIVEWISGYLLVSAVMAFVMFFIYFMMENPDLKIINDLEKGKEEVEEASKAKTDFLSNMSHDIRTPMNAIIGFSESLLMENLSDTQRNEVQNIYEAATTLLEIINNILDVSRIESGKEEKIEKIYEFRKVVMQLTSVITTKIDLNKVRLNVQIDKNIPSHFIGDELKIYQILMNLLSNAAKYTEKGQIDFIVTTETIAETAKLKFVISDTGIGIKESDYDKMFVKFSRIHNQENYRSIEGTGLGLVITKSLVELLGGTITFESKYGEGTKFTVIIPQKVHNIVADASIINQNMNRTGTVSNVHFDGSLYDILVVDDNNLNLKVAERILRDYKFQITLAGSGDEAIEKLKNGQRFDMIFLDHMMPIKDGIQTLHEIKALQNVKIPPVIALTANAMVGMKEKYLKEGFDGYISKPINREELQELLNNFFCRK